MSNDVEIDIHKGIGAMYAALDRMAQIAGDVPIHVIFGGKPDYRYGHHVIDQSTRAEINYRTQEIKDALCDPKHGRTMASIHTIEGAGHSVSNSTRSSNSLLNLHQIAQEKPIELSNVMYGILKGSTALPTAKL